MRKISGEVITRPIQLRAIALRKQALLLCPFPSLLRAHPVQLLFKVIDFLLKRVVFRFGAIFILLYNLAVRTAFLLGGIIGRPLVTAKFDVGILIGIGRVRLILGYVGSMVSGRLRRRLVCSGFGAMRMSSQHTAR